MKIFKITFILAFILSIFISNLLPFFCECDKLKDSVIRIHVLANSNSEKDQLLKYKVKDNISSAIFKLLKNVSNKGDARKIILSNLKNISKLSQKEIRKNGYNYNIDVLLTRSYFPTRKYDSFVLPAGKYDALKVIIGEGKGKNWWCVAFPPMCSPIYNNDEDVRDVLDSKQLEIIKKPCEYKFAILEIIYNIKNYINQYHVVNEV